MKIYKILFLLISIIFFTGCSNRSVPRTTLTIKNKIINIEVADSWPERIKGLSGRDNLCLDCGLLFIFDKKAIYPFWMKEMKFPIDILWINDNKVVYFVENAQIPHDGNIPTYTPTIRANKVLEVNSGFIKDNNIKEGDILK